LSLHIHGDRIEPILIKNMEISETDPKKLFPQKSTRETIYLWALMILKVQKQIVVIKGNIFLMYIYHKIGTKTVQRYSQYWRHW